MHGEDATASVYMKKISLEMTNRTACHLFFFFSRDLVSVRAVSGHPTFGHT
jgi:hypothetical protein